jgi:DNA-binding transcriptional ArsR family regulator
LATDTGPGAGPAKVDRLIHEPARLSIMANLFVVESANATYVLQQTGLTWGNLGSHLARLEEAGYLTMTKGFRGKQPQTTIALTPLGRSALLEYRRRLLETLDHIG